MTKMVFPHLKMHVARIDKPCFYPKKMCVITEMIT
jgi:hypothetical protein